VSQQTVTETGPRIAAALSDGTVRVSRLSADVQSAEPLAVLQGGGAGHMTAVTWSHNGQLLAGCCGSGDVVVWDTARSYSLRAVLRVRAVCCCIVMLVTVITCRYCSCCTLLLQAATVRMTAVRTGVVQSLTRCYYSLRKLISARLQYSILSS
jgi:WD40 repeat protein